MADEQRTEPEMTSAFWFQEWITPELAIKSALKSLTFDSKSEFQRVQVVETAPFGKTLVLDGKTQSAKNDEHIYHESLVHPAMLQHPDPKTVYIGGGGELATAREVLKHNTVEKCVMVDIDKTVVDICKEQLPEWNAGSTEDPRLELHFDDAKKFLEEDDRKYDVIIMDIADPIEAGPGIVLYTEEFYKFAATKLNPGGVLVTQSGPGSHFNITECFTAINQTLRRAFNCVVPLSADIPSFGSNWGFNIAFNAEGDAAEASEALVERRAKDTDALVAKRLSRPLRYYDGITHRGLFGVPKEVREKIEAEERVMTIANPVFMF